MTQNNETTPVLAFEIDSQGRVLERLLTDKEQHTLGNTLLMKLYPNIKVAVATVPMGFLDSFEESQVANALARIPTDKVEYYLAGGGPAAKDGRFDLVDSGHIQLIAERFQYWPEAAITNFGALISPCKVMIDEPDLTVLAVKDRKFGTNDCGGWVRRSLFQKIKQQHDDELFAKHRERLLEEQYHSVPFEDLSGNQQSDLGSNVKQQVARKLMQPHCMYQFRLAFENTQAKGCLKVMEDDVADALGCDIILPVSSIKPGLQLPKGLEKTFEREGKKFRGRVILGIREVSAERTYGSSYQLVEHAPDDSIELEIEPQCFQEVQKFSEALGNRDFETLLEIIGLEDPGAERKKDDETRIVEAALMADGEGEIVTFPWINNQLNKMFARWASRTAIGGGLRLPGFTLAHDGYLVFHNGHVYSGSDWIPKNKAITTLDSRRGLCVRYPIRSFDDLLPLEHLSTTELIALLATELERQGCDPDTAGVLAKQIVPKQLQLEGTYTLHSETAAKNGGDYDGDGMCVIEEQRFPRFVEHRFAHQGKPQPKKDKKKARTPWRNLPALAMKARGNQIGRITDLKTSCLAAGRADLAEKLVEQLQLALDSLKWDVQPDRRLIDSIDGEVERAAWLNFKRVSTISKLPLHLDVAPNDRIGRIYNDVRKEIADPAESKATVADFKMLVSGEEVTRPMHDECRYVNSVFAAYVSRIMERQDRLSDEYERANSEFDEVRQDGGKALRQQKYDAKSKAYTAKRKGEERTRKEMGSLLTWIRLWAEGKKENRRAWLQALLTVVCGGSGNGAILWHAFPQEIVNVLAEITSRPALRVPAPDLDGVSSKTDNDGRTFLVYNNGAKDEFLFRKTKSGEIIPGTLE